MFDQRYCRAVDDLYTLTEMDGNLWQARNIVQLLDESTADFRQVCPVSCATTPWADCCDRHILSLMLGHTQTT